MRYLKLVVTASLFFSGVFLASAGLAQDVPTEQADPADGLTLLEQLRTAEPGRAESLADRLRREWSNSGSATADFLLNRGRKAMERGDTQAAIEHFTAVIDHAPEFAQGWAERARAYFDLELFGPAVGDLENVLALNPHHFEAIMGLAVILDTMNRPEDAYQAYLEVKSIHPHQPGLTEALTRLEPQVRGQEL